jgi:serine/threonine-protein kinase
MSRLHQPLSSAISFQFLAEIAVGSTARIDLCRAVGGERNGQLLAVKRLLPHIAEDPGYASMFLDEVWMTASLKHPNVVEVAGWGTDAQGAYLAVELVQGVSLARLMKTVFDTGEIFSERMVVFIGSKICSGLAVAHALRSPDGELLNLVHRDLTPANVLLGFNGDVKIADFGLAKAKQRLTKTLTGLLKGQPQYMSPEQAKGGQEIDGRSDLFSLGVVLFELFAGRRPWSATSELEMVHVAANEPPVDLREYRPKIDKELVAVVMRCLEKDPAARFQSAVEVEARLDTWLRAHGYVEGTEEALARFVRRNAMRQMRWFERAVSGELAPMPDSMRPSAPNPMAPRVPSYSNVTNAPHGRVSPSITAAPRARVRPRKPIDSEATDVTDVESRVAALHAQGSDRPPVIVDKDGRAPVAGAEIDWGEEIPTLVQKQGHSSSLAERARVRPRPIRNDVRPIEPLYEEPSIADDDSNRTTAVKKPSRPLPGSTFRADGGALPRRSVESLVDLESEEVPTVPLKHALHRPPAPLDPLAPRARPASQPPRPMMPVVPPPPPVPMPPGADRRLREVATPSGVRVAGMGVDPAPMSREAPLSEALLLSEADRLAALAVRVGEEAKAAAALAVRKTSLAKIAGDAAAIAADAVRVAATAGLQHGARRLEEALALEESLRRGDASPHSVSPASMGRNGTHAMPGAASAASEIRGPHLPDFSRPSSSPSHPMLADANAPLGFNQGGFRQMPDVSSTADQFKNTFDPQMFRAQLKPEIWGMPRPVAIALFLVTFVIFIIFLWVVT